MLPLEALAKARVLIDDSHIAVCFGLRLVYKHKHKEQTAHCDCEFGQVYRALQKISLDYIKEESPC